MVMALQAARIGAQDVDAINARGTGTQANDRTSIAVFSLDGAARLATSITRPSRSNDAIG